MKADTEKLLATKEYCLLGHRSLNDIFYYFAEPMYDVYHVSITCDIVANIFSFLCNFAKTMLFPIVVVISFKVLVFYYIRKTKTKLNTVVKPYSDM